MSTITTFPALYRREESRAIVANIRANPQDDIARLVYSEWLEENAGDDPDFLDHYTARIQFLRAGCTNPGKSLSRLNRAESKWLDDNWQRLFPTLMRVHGYHDRLLSHNQGWDIDVDDALQWRKGRVFRFSIRYHFRNGRANLHHGHVDLRDYAGYFTAELRRGFIDRIDWHDNLPYWTRLMPAIAKDDPFVCCRFPGLAGGLIRHEDGTWIRRIRRSYIGEEVFRLLRPTVRGPLGHDQHASYMSRHRVETLNMVSHDLNRASREWAEAVPITVSMTDAEFFGDTQWLAESWAYPDSPA